MAVRFSAESQTYTASLSLGSQAALTMCCWARIATDRNAFSAVFGVDSGVAGDSMYFETAVDGTTMRIVYDNSSATNMQAMTVGTWYFLAVSVSGTSGTAYWRALNATSWTTATANPAASGFTMTTARVGVFPNAGEWWNGNVTGIKVWNAQLSQADLDAEYLQHYPQRLANLVAWYPLLTTETPDYSGNGKSLSGGASATVEDGPGIPWADSGPLFYLAKTVSGTIATDFAFAGTISGTRTVPGTIATTFAFDGAVAGTRTVLGTVATAFAFDAPAAGTRTVPGTIATTFAFDAPVSGGRETFGAIATAFAFDAPASGAPIVSGSIATGFAFDAPAAGTVTVLGVVATTFAFDAPAAGTATVSGAIVTDFAFAAVAAGGRTTFGAIATDFAFSAPAAGERVVEATASTALSFTADAAGTVTVLGSATLPIDFVATAIADGIISGQALTELEFSAPVVGVRTIIGAATLPVAFTAAASGTRSVQASALGAFVFAAAALGVRTVFGSAELAIAFAGPLVGRAPSSPMPSLTTTSHAGPGRTSASTTGGDTVTTGRMITTSSRERIVTA